MSTANIDQRLYGKEMLIGKKITQGIRCNTLSVEVKKH